MANTKSAIKCIRSSERKRQRNRVVRSRARNYVKKTWRQIEAGELEQAQETAQLAVKALDKAAAKGTIHKNNAARRKSRLLQRLHQAVEAQAAQ